MSRLFVKIFLWFVVVALGVVGLSIAVWDATRPGSQDPFAAFGIEGEKAKFAGGSVVRVDQLQVMKEPLKWISQHGIGLAVFTKSGQVLMKSSDDVESTVRALVAESFREPAALAQAGPDGSLLLAIPVNADAAVGSIIPPQRLPLPTSAIAIRVGAITLLVLLVCLALAKYLSSPVEKFRAATARLAAGDLSARVGPELGRRRDELADAGRDFDRMAERIQELVESDRRLIADVSHELRSPLARLNVAIQLERKNGDQADDGGDRPMLDRIERETARLDELIGQLLTLARLRNSSHEPPRDAVDVGQVAADVVTDAEFEAHASGRRIALHRGEDCTVTGDPGLLRSALENIVRNALHYTPPSTEVEIDVDQCPGGVRVLVRDHGDGVPDASLDRLFEPFYREDDSRTRATGGAGLGLSIVARVMAVHGGVAQARNAAGGGLEVDLTLPRGGVNIS